MSGIILHQYDSSPFTEKVRICLGIKGLAWQAVDQPVIIPKPDLTPLTGGYRRIPVMQIGADVYCDSALIVRELDRRYPTPSLFPAGNKGQANAVEIWAEKALFQSAVLAIFGTLGDGVDPAFIKDREALSGQPFNVAAMKALAPFALTQIKAHAALLAEYLADGRSFLEGEAPGLADAAAYYNFWFIRSNMAPADALAMAKASDPVSLDILPSDEALRGRTVALSATDYGRDPIVGIFAGSTHSSLTVLLQDPELGAIAVHVPRLGYSVTVS